MAPEGEKAGGFHHEVPELIKASPYHGDIILNRKLEKFVMIFIAISLPEGYCCFMISVIYIGLQKERRIFNHYEP